MSASQPIFEKVTTFILDVDGVLTDGTILVLENGLQVRRMSIRDGYALQLAVKKGYTVVILSGAAASPVVDRLQKLGISEIHMGVTDKGTFIHNYQKTNNADRASVLFMGDDVPDLPGLRAAGVAACPADAIDDVKNMATYISPINGGYGCVRDVIEKVMRARGDWQGDTSTTSS